MHGRPEKKIEICAQLKSYPIEHIYNVDETALFFKSLPRHTYVLQNENNRELRRIRKMTVKDRVSAYVCTNANGTQKAAISIIGVSKNPRVFRYKTPSCKYLGSLKVWFNTRLF